MSENRSKTVVIIALCLTLIFMGVGFAALSQELTINTEGTIVASEWDIHLDEFETGATVVSGDETVTATATGDGSNAVTLNFTLEKPGDKVQFTGKAVNNGTIAAVLSGDVADSFNGKNLVKKTVVTMPADGDDLAATNGEATIVVTYEFISTIEEVPTESVDFSDTIVLNYVQK